MILVTGANGFIGSILLEDLYLRGLNPLVANDVVSLKERQHLINPEHIAEFVTSNDLARYLDSQSGDKISAVFHMGAISSTTEKSWDRLVENNIELSKRLFQFTKKHKIPFIYASSGAVYGDGKSGFSDQADVSSFAPLNLYGKSKSEFDDWMLKNLSGHVKCVGLRFFNVYGPNEYHKGEMASLVYKAFQQIQETGSLKLFRSHREDYKDGMQKRDFVYVKDISRWMIEIYENKNFQSGIYNMGFGTARTWLDLANAIFESVKKPMRIEWMDMPDHIRNQYQYFTEADMNKSFSQGLSKPQFSIEAGVKDYIQNYLKSPSPYYSRI